MEYPFLLDRMTLLLNSKQFELLTKQDFKFKRLYTHLCTEHQYDGFSGFDDMSYCVFHVADYLNYFKCKPDSLYLSLELLFADLPFYPRDVILTQIEFSLDIDVSFEKEINLFQMLILYYKKKQNSKKTILISDLEKSTFSSFSTRKDNVQIVIYNKQLEILKGAYTYDSPPLTRIEFRFFSLFGFLTKSFLNESHGKVFEFFASYDKSILARIEDDISANLLNNFKIHRNIFYQTQSPDDKFSIKSFLLTQKHFILTKRILRLFYSYLKEERFVLGNFDSYYANVLKNVSFNFVTDKAFESFFGAIAELEDPSFQSHNLSIWFFPEPAVPFS